MLVVELLGRCNCDQCADQALAVCNKVVALLFCVVSSCACEQGNVNAAAIKTCLCVRDGHVYIVYIVKSHACLSKVGDKEFMKVGTGWSCNRLAF